MKNRNFCKLLAITFIVTMLSAGCGASNTAPAKEEAAPEATETTVKEEETVTDETPEAEPVVEEATEVETITEAATTTEAATAETTAATDETAAVAETASVTEATKDNPLRVVGIEEEVFFFYEGGELFMSYNGELTSVNTTHEIHAGDVTEEELPVRLRGRLKRERARQKR